MEVGYEGCYASGGGLYEDNGKIVVPVPRGCRVALACRVFEGIDGGDRNLLYTVKI